VTAGAVSAAPRTIVLGRPFVGPLFDTMLIGGGLSLLTVAVLQGGDGFGTGWLRTHLPLCILLANVTHFAASTVRLYSKPGSFAELPFLTMGLPLATFAVLSLAVVFSHQIGPALQALYLTWSPFHYAAQTYGLATIYCLRSQRRLGDPEQRLLWWTCMLPFAYALVKLPNAGIGWFLSPWFFAGHPALAEARFLTEQAIGLATFAVPALLAWRIWQTSARTLPLISWLLVLTNGIWWVVFTYLSAFAWATVFHGVQYLAIVVIFHLRDHPPTTSGRLAWLWPTVKFYATCLALGWLLFEVWPYAYVLAGFTLSESMLLCVAAINVHHFIVDRGIWRIRRDPNYRIVVAGDAPVV
jgi:hypothetical protein